RAADGDEQRLEIHEQRGVERTDAQRRAEHPEDSGGDRDAEGNEGDPAGDSGGRLPVLRQERRQHEQHGRGEHRIPGDLQRIGTSTRSIAMNRRKTLPANKTPRPSAMRRARPVNGAGRGTSRSHTYSIASPSTQRALDIVSASAPALKVTRVRISAQANEKAP